jgi:NAD(P)-dependent dehydrogenase (short-subunit alcohol dehydrogenase family)
VFVPADVADESAVASLAGRPVERFGTIDILVNNAAGIDDMRTGADGPVHMLDLEVFDRLINVTSAVCLLC